MNSEREKLIEQAKEITGESSKSKAIDEAIRMAISFDDLTDQLRREAVDDLTGYEMEHHRFNVSTDLSERSRRR